MRDLVSRCKRIDAADVGAVHELALTNARQTMDDPARVAAVEDHQLHLGR